MSWVVLQRGPPASRERYRDCHRGPVHDPHDAHRVRRAV